VLLGQEAPEPDAAEPLESVSPPDATFERIPPMTFGERETITDLIGRERDLRLIRNFVLGIPTGGGALVVTGEPGVGKTALLSAAAEMARDSGFRVLRSSGAEFEVDVRFSALNQALLPISGMSFELSPSYRRALLIATGFEEGPLPDEGLVASAALALLTEAASLQPLLLIVDDLSWVDRASASVFHQVAQGLTGTPAGFLGGTRPDSLGVFADDETRTHVLEPLSEESANELLSARFPDLAIRVRKRLLTEARGNPLALLELPALLTVPQRSASQALPLVLPLNRRLQALFASRITELPSATRHLLLLAALDTSGDLRVLGGAAAVQSIDLSYLDSAEQSRLIYVDQSTQRMAFRHPLIRAAVIHLASAADRRMAHRTLAATTDAQSEGHAWHLAEASIEPDDEVAALLERSAGEALKRGDAITAVTALTRSAYLSPQGADRARRLAEAAYIGADVTGDVRLVPQLLAEARRADPEHHDSLQAATAAASMLLNSDGDIDTAHRLLAGAIESQLGQPDVDLPAVTEALQMLLIICWFAGPRPELWEPFNGAIERLKSTLPVPLSLGAEIFADPARATNVALDRLDAAVRALEHERDPAYIIRVGMTAALVDRLPDCREAYSRVVSDGRDGGATASAISALNHLSLDAYARGVWDEAERVAEESIALCTAHGYPTVSWTSRYTLALISAARGDYDKTRSLADEMMQWAVPRGVRAVQHYAIHARASAALARGDYEDAYQYTTAINERGPLPRNAPLALWCAMDPVEAAVRAGRSVVAGSYVSAMQRADIARISPRLALLAAGSAAIAATDAESLSLFERAVALPGVAEYKFDLARVQLAFGERLRRARATIESRSQLAAAAQAFEGLGAEPWANRAASEFRATGPTRSREAEFGNSPLTPQEREIARLAATGLTNKEIGARLFLSHRTVGAHLARIFPKLGISSRAALRDALDRAGE
jgi:DNA-binding CsgD family transcriptional regulator